MSDSKKIKSALISVFNKDGLEPICDLLKTLNIKVYSTGGTQVFLEKNGVKVTPVEEITSYPAIFDGRVKTLHPAIFGGILYRREDENHQEQAEKFSIPDIDLVVVDLYPFEDTVSSGASHEDIIEKIDIGGISLIRGAAKNYEDVVIIPSKNEYDSLTHILHQDGVSSLEDRRALSSKAFSVSSRYDTAIHKYLSYDAKLQINIDEKKELRYGENPHQAGAFYGDFDAIFDQLHGKELSYNNLLDIDAAYNLMAEFKEDLPTFAILKHNNACGLATRSTMAEAYKDALAGDPVSAFGGILICNGNIDKETAEQIHELFCEVVIAPSFDQDALEVLKGKKNRVILTLKRWDLPAKTYRSILNGMLVQDRDKITETIDDFEDQTSTKATMDQKSDLEFANKIAKHTKSNTIVLAKNKQLLASGTGQTSRVDALRQAIHKAQSFEFDLNGAVMASDAFFPFPDCVEIANEAGIKAVVQPGGSIKDKLSIEYCENNNMAMVFSGNRHFKH